jgi:hypothetical protein
MDKQEDSQPEDTASAVKIIYVSDIKDSTTDDSITLFFGNKKRSGGGDLCKGKEGYKRLSATVARLKFVSLKGNSVSNSCILPNSLHSFSNSIRSSWSLSSSGHLMLFLSSSGSFPS